MYIYPELKDDDMKKIKIEYHYKNPDIDFHIVDDVYVFDLDNILCKNELMSKTH